MTELDVPEDCGITMTAKEAMEDAYCTLTEEYFVSKCQAPGPATKSKISKRLFGHRRQIRLLKDARDHPRTGLTLPVVTMRCLTARGDNAMPLRWGRGLTDRVVASGFRRLGVVPADHELSCAWEAMSHVIVTTYSDGIITIMPTATQISYGFT